MQVFDIGGADFDLEAFLAGFQRVVSQHQVGGHHLGQAGDRHRRLASAGAEGAESLDRHRRLALARPGEVEALAIVGGPLDTVARHRPDITDPYPGKPKGEQKDGDDRRAP